jgi:succinyl-CoA synthetase alpha subunit
MLEYGTKVVAGVTPGKKGQRVHGVPVFNTVEEAVNEEGANTSIIFVPAAFASDAIMEAAYSGVKLIVAITEGIPVNDMVKLMPILKEKGVRLIGPNCPGLITPEEAKVGILPGQIFKRGKVGVISRSGTLTYEIVSHITARGLGESTAIIAGDLILPENLKNKRVGYAIYQKAIKNGAFLRPLGNTIYWLPPLNIKKTELELLRNITEKSINEILS